MERNDDVELQISELKRLITSTTNEERKLLIKNQIRDLEVVREHILRSTDDPVNIKTTQKRSSLVRPASARPRKGSLLSVTEDKEIHPSLLTTELCAKKSSNVCVLNPALIYDITSVSLDPKFPISHIIDLDSRKFWISTGLFPQLVCIYLRKTVHIASIEITLLNIKKLCIRCTHSRSVISPKPITIDFHAPKEPDKTSTSSKITKRVDFEGDAIDVIQLDIIEGYGDFCVIYSVRIKIDQENI